METIIKEVTLSLAQIIELIAAIAALRTALNYFLERELRNTENS
jgi:uncharacterized membrane protein